MSSHTADQTHNKCHTCEPFIETWEVSSSHSEVSACDFSPYPWISNLTCNTTILGPSEEAMFPPYH